MTQSRPKYLLCQRHRSHHRKPIEVCHICAHRSDCRAYQAIQPASFEEILMQLGRVVVPETPPPKEIDFIKRELMQIRKRIDKYN